MTTNPQTELTETQKAYNVAQHEIFQLAAYGHCTYTNGELLTEDGKRMQRDYNDRIRTAREELEAAVLRLVAEHGERYRTLPEPVVGWLRTLADDAGELSLLAVRPDKREDELPAAVVPGPPATRAAVLRDFMWRLEQSAGDAAAEKFLDDNPELRRMADEAQQQPDTGTPGCWCGHAEDRHWKDQSGRMTFPEGCHDCRGWNGAHGYGQELPWLPEGEEPAAGARQDGAQP